MQQMPAAAGMHLYANGYRPVMDALLPLLLSMAVSWFFFRKAGWRQIGTVLIIVNAAPIGSNIAVYAQRLGLDSSYAVQMVCLSTLLSLITLPVMLSLAAALGFA